MNMVNVINGFRRQNGRSDIWDWDFQVCEYCRMHTYAMIRENRLYHSEPYLREGWSEAVAMCDYGGGSIDDVKRRLIYDIIGNSEGHRQIVLDSNTLAYSLVINDGKAYLTIRGK
jgi:uncharacterized protein YkwD